MAGLDPAIQLKESLFPGWPPMSSDLIRGSRAAMTNSYMQPVGFGSPPILQACFAGP